MAEVTAGESVQTGTHFDIIADDEESIASANEPDILMDPHFQGAINYPAFEELMAQRKYRTMVKASYEGEKYRFCGVSLGRNHLAVLVKTDRIVDIPEAVYLTFKDSSAINLDVARRLSRMARALDKPEEAPWAPGQQPQS